MAIIRKIIEIKLNSDMIYTLGKNTETFIVEEIVFRRDGMTGINKGAKDEAHYLIRLMGELNDRNVRFMMIPAREVGPVTFVEEETGEKKDDIKIEKVE